MGARVLRQEPLIWSYKLKVNRRIVATHHQRQLHDILNSFKSNRNVLESDFDWQKYYTINLTVSFRNVPSSLKFMNVRHEVSLKFNLTIYSKKDIWMIVYIETLTLRQ